MQIDIDKTEINFVDLLWNLINKIKIRYWHGF